MSHDVIATTEMWCICWEGELAYFCELAVGDELTTGLENLEEYFDRQEAVERMRDFDPWFEVPPVNVNTDEIDRLTLLEGIGNVLAQDIIDNRIYYTMNQLWERVDGVSEAMVDSWGDHVQLQELDL